MRRDKSFLDKAPLLYLVATPIGNLDEFSKRALDVVNLSDIVASEDTRNAASLLAKFDVHGKKFVSVREHNEREASESLVKMMLEGKKACYMSDAGYPAISDPGSVLVDTCLKSGINVSVVNGSSALLAALVASGLDTSHFYFHGFLDARATRAEKELRERSTRKETFVIYESPHRIKKTLALLYKVLGNRRAVIARELTKVHEEYIRGTLEELKEIEESSLIGEMVIVIEGAPQIEEECSLEDILGFLKEEEKNGLHGKELVQAVAKSHSLSKKAVYSAYLSLKETD